MVKEMNIKTSHCDGYKVNNVYKILKKSINEIRKTSKPIFLEFSTYSG